MKLSKKISLTLITFLIFILSNPIFAQKLEPKKRVLEPDHTITSKIMGKDYQLYISFPESYSTKDTISYPVLYVLDGAIQLPILGSVQEYLSFGREIEEVIIVGIGSGLDFPTWFINRTYDYTPSLDTISDRENEKEFGFPEGTIKSGGAVKFLDCIKSEIVPFVDKHYKTTSERGITGHSLGGLFTAFCFINSSGYFTRFGINSPSIHWNKEELLNQAVLKFAENENWDIPPTKVFISVGELEGIKMVPTMVKFSSYLENSDYENINLSWQIFDNESHLSVIPAILSRTLSVLYGKK